MFTLLSVRRDLDVFEWFLSTLFDASLLETQSRARSRLFFGPELAPQETEFNEMYRLDLGAGLHMIRNGA